jgi:transposase-like protein
MKYTASVITSALDLYFKGLSLRSIADHLSQIHGFHTSHLTVYRWVRTYMRLIVSYVRQLKPRLSRTWHADEMSVKVSGTASNLWNLMDHRTRYLVAVQIRKYKGATQAKQLLANGLRKAEQKRLVLISDGQRSYPRAVRNLQKTNASISIKHVVDSGLAKRQSNNRLERLNGTVRQRLKTMRGLDNTESSRRFARDFAVYYNYIRPHFGLRGKTPSQAARTWSPTMGNRWYSLIRDSVTKSGAKRS